MAHITGGGLAGNLQRALNPGVDAVIDRGAWDVPAVFGFLQARGGVEQEEMSRVFNMGVGYCLVVRPTFTNAIVERLGRMGETARVIGKITRGKGGVRERG